MAKSLECRVFADVSTKARNVMPSVLHITLQRSFQIPVVLRLRALQYLRYSFDSPEASSKPYNRKEGSGTIVVFMLFSIIPTFI